MKTIIKLASLILIILCQIACRSTKSSNRQKVNSTEIEQTETRSREQENKQYARSYSLTDSSGQFYQLTIFPVDSFQFSLREGFKGKANKVELRGSIHQLKRMTDSSVLILSANKQANSTRNRKVSIKKLDHAKSVKKTGLSWWWIFVAGGVSVATIWVWRRVRNGL